jgi:hypothetical protein
LKMKVEETELGVTRSSEAFVQALIVVCLVRQHNRDARISNFRNLGFSHEVTHMISKSALLVEYIGGGN